MKPGDLVYLKEDPHTAWANARKNFGLGTIVKMEPVGVEHPGQPWNVYVHWTGLQGVTTHSKHRLKVITNV